MMILCASHLQPKDASCSMTFWYNLVVIILKKTLKRKSLKHCHKSNKKKKNKITKDPYILYINHIKLLNLKIVKLENSEKIKF